MEETDVPLRLGNGHHAAAYSDDGLGRALDTLAAVNPKEGFTAVAAQAYPREQVRLARLPWDSTSKRVYGVYPAVEAVEEGEARTPEASAADAPNVRQAPPAVPKRGDSKNGAPICRREF